jgi:threonine synthase
MDAKALIDAQGLGCEPASACSLAGLKKLVDKGVITADETVVGILTGHILKDAEAIINYHNNAMEHVEAHYPNKLHQAEPTVADISRILALHEPLHS